MARNVRRLSKEEIKRRTHTCEAKFKTRMISTRGNVEKVSEGEIIWAEMTKRPGDRFISVPVVCSNCKRKSWHTARVINNRLQRKSGFTGCCKKCRDTGRQKEKNPVWKGGRRINAAGYVEVRPEKNDEIGQIMKGRREYVPEHRLAVAHHIGRPLQTGEHVHHTNFVKTDNRIENLQVVTNDEHGRLAYVAMLNKRIKKLERLLSRHGIPIPS